MHKIPILTFGTKSSGPTIVNDRGGGKVSDDNMVNALDAEANSIL
jgi:hypothetical protein